jgi:3-isopropylmalate/(R)-2-methylmalate dehydratase small subunit
MEKFIRLEGLVAPLDRANVDTDAIIPKQFLKSIKRTGFGPNLFDQWRYLDHGEPGMNNSSRPLNPDFVLNQPRYRAAQILLARKISVVVEREHAPRGAAGLRFPCSHRAQLRGHFSSNCLKNGVLPIGLRKPKWIGYSTR